MDPGNPRHPPWPRWRQTPGLHACSLSPYDFTAWPSDVCPWSFPDLWVITSPPTAFSLTVLQSLEPQSPPQPWHWLRLGRCLWGLPHVAQTQATASGILSPQHHSPSSQTDTQQNILFVVQRLSCILGKIVNWYRVDGIWRLVTHFSITHCSTILSFKWKNLYFLMFLLTVF